MVKQIKFEDLVGNVYGGLLVDDFKDNTYIICGHCGQIIPLDNIEGHYKILEKYDTWVDLTETITGD